MPSTAAPLADAFGARLTALSRRPWTLAGILFLLNALFVPYLGIIHDAQIYSGLVLNRLDPELLAGDLFFQFGSQDKFSLFSPLLAPLAGEVGLETAFFIGYLISIAFFMVAVVRFITRLWPDSPGAVAGLVFLALIPVEYGGFVPLHVLEPFLSARIPACAFTLWAMSDLLDQRVFRGAIFLALGAALHPLMALPGAMLVILVAIQRHWGTRGTAFLIGVACALLAGLLAYPPLAYRLFGQADGEWFELNRQSNCYQFPLEWTAEQWLRNLFALAALGIAAWQVRNLATERSRVLAAASLIGIAGFFGCLAFTQLDYALLLKGQAYRWLWLPLALMPPTLFDMVCSAWRSAEHRRGVAVLAIPIAFELTGFGSSELLAFLVLMPLVVYAFVVYAKSMPWTDKLNAAVILSVLASLTLCAVCHVWAYLTLGGELREQASIYFEIAIILIVLGPGVVFPLCMIGTALLERLGRTAPATVAMVLAGLALHLGMFGWTQSEQFKSHRPMSEELRFVDRFLNQHRAESATPICVYSDFGKLGQYWVEWRTRSFYDSFQLAGMVFHRETAVEGKRRATIVAPFEAAGLSKKSWQAMPEICKPKIEAWLDRRIENSPPPQADDLMRLARESSIDYVILFNSRVDGLATAQCGKVSIYDCRALRGDTPDGRHAAASRLLR